MKKAYSDKLKNPLWQKRRLQILERDSWTCAYCGDKETTLHIHHAKYTGEPWEAPDEDLITLCEHCHFQIDYDEMVKYTVRVKKWVVETNNGNDVNYLFENMNGQYFLYVIKFSPNEDPQSFSVHVSELFVNTIKEFVSK